MIVNTATLKGDPVLAKARDSGTDPAGFDGELKTTRLYPDPSETAVFVRDSEDISRSTKAPSRSRYSASPAQRAGSLGDPENIRFRCDPRCSEMVVPHKL